MGKIVKTNSPQGVEFINKISEIYETLLLTDGYDGSAERLNQNFKFWKELEKLAKKCANGPQYADEIVPTDKGYPEEYRVKDLNDQIEILADFFKVSPVFAKNFAKKLPEVPPIERAEGWFAFIKSESIVSNLSQLSISQVQCKAMKIILQQLDLCNECRGYNSLEEKFKPDTKTLNFLSRIKLEQEGDIFIIPAQHGIYHKGKSNSRARETLLANEFGLGGVHVGCMMITHPERYKKGCLSADCPGDRISFFSKSNYRDAIMWHLSGDKRIRCSVYVDTASEYSAPVTGFYMPAPY